MTSLHFSTTYPNLSYLEQQERTSLSLQAQQSEFPTSCLFNILYSIINHRGFNPLPHPTKEQYIYLAGKQFIDLKSELITYINDHPGYTSDLSKLVEALFFYHLIALHVSKQLDFKQLLNKWTQQLSEGHSVNDIVRNTQQSSPELSHLFISYSYKHLKTALDQLIPPEINRFKNNCADILKGLSQPDSREPDQPTPPQSESFNVGSFFDLFVF